MSSVSLQSRDSTYSCLNELKIPFLIPETFYGLVQKKIQGQKKIKNPASRNTPLLESSQLKHCPNQLKLATK